MRIASAAVKEKGLQHDRRWMLVDENNIFMTQRIHPSMALFRLSAEGAMCIITHGKDSIKLPFIFSGMGPTIQTEVWGNAVTTIEVSGEHTRWFSERLGIKCRLVFFPEENSRLVDPSFAVNHEHVSLADGYPFLIIGQSSLNDLNLRLDNPVPMNRFRPNLVFTGGSPYEEDGWKGFTIGKNRFAGVKPCSRCIITSVNQDTGEKGLEPMATLSGYRKGHGEVYFGQNVLAIDHHEIHEGDEISFE